MYTSTCYLVSLHVYSDKTGKTVCQLKMKAFTINPLNAKLNPICHLLALIGAHSILHVSRI